LLVLFIACSIQSGNVIVLPPSPVLQCAAVGVHRRSTERAICIACTLRRRRRHFLPRTQVNAVAGPAHRPHRLEQHLPHDVRERDIGAAGRLQCRLRGRGGRGGFRLATASVLAAPSDGHVAERAALGPVPAARLAEVPRLRAGVVVVVAELGVGGAAPRGYYAALTTALVGAPPTPLSTPYPLPCRKNTHGEI
jgi:hypothetical protein